jgi:prepilin-type N-terminal cleavage/methylation domain-containing protein
MNKKGFTLIELLVVVLIIGILAAIALPQYFKAVEKSRASEALSVLGTIAAAEERFRLASSTGVYTTDFGALDIEFSPVGGGTATGASFATKNFTITLSGTGAGAGVKATRSGNSGYYIIKDYATGAMTCADGGNGICASIGIGS